MRSWKKPTTEQVEQAVARLAHREQVSYFFEKLQNPLWLEPMVRKHFFDQPPPAERDEVKGSIRFPVWPASRYLARIAGHNGTQELVLKTALGIPDTDNVRVHEDLADVACELPARLAAAFVKKAKKWLESDFQLLLPSKLAMLTERLGRGGEVDAALVLARSLLVLKKAEGRGVVGRISEYEYAQALKGLTPVLATAGEPALQLLCDLLEQASRLSSASRERGEEEDYSYIWRSAIDEPESEPDARDSLVTAARDVAAAVAGASAGQQESVLALLQARPRRVFKRLALWVLAQHPEYTLERADAALMDGFDLPGVAREYEQFSRAAFSAVSAATREQFLKRVEQGPDPDRTRRMYEAIDREVTADQLAQTADRWRLERLEPVSDALPPEWRGRYEAFLTKYGRPQPHKRAHAEWVGTRTPMTLEELRQTTMSELVAFLRTWVPGDDFLGPSKEGLADTLSALAAAEPLRFDAEVLSQVAELDAAYVRAVVMGFRNAVNAAGIVDWGAVLGFCSKVTLSPSTARETSWARTAVAELLRASFTKEGSGITPKNREAVWSLIESVMRDPDPGPDREEGGGNPLELAINSTRGAAFEAAVEYGLWTRRIQEAAPGGDSMVSRGFIEMPELRSFLERYLDEHTEPSKAIRSLYGRWFPWLVVLDGPWARDNALRVFSTKPSQVALGEAAWDAYLAHCPPYDNVFPMIADAYSRAVEKLKPAPGLERNSRDDPSRHLGDHLMALYWRGRLNLAPEGLIARFFEEAPPAARAHAVDSVGRALGDGVEPLAPEVLSRMVDLWEWRWKAVSDASRMHAAEIAAFGWWFASGKLQPTWALTHLALVIDAVGEADPDFGVAAQLAKMAEVYPLEGAQIVGALIRGDREGWRILSIKDDARTVLAAALSSGNAAAREEATRVINDLGASGFHEFRSLIKSRGSA